MKKIIVALALVVGVLGVSGCDISTSTKERYKITTATINGKTESTFPIMVDSVTGRTWYLTSGMYWNPIMLSDKLPKTSEEERLNSGMSYMPNK